MSSSDTPPGHVARAWFRYGAAWLEPGGVFCRMVSWDAVKSALCSKASLWWEVAQANQNGCSVCCLRTCRLS